MPDILITANLESEADFNLLREVIEAEFMDRFNELMKPVLEEWDRQDLEGTGEPDHVVGVLNVGKELMQNNKIIVRPDMAGQLSEMRKEYDERREMVRERVEWDRDYHALVASEHLRDVHHSRSKVFFNPRLRSVRGVQGWRKK